MKIITIYVLLSAVLLCRSNTINNIRLEGHSDYMVEVVGQTMRKVEEMEWCNLKVNDISLDIEEDVLGTKVIGKVDYINGFLVSIQWMDIEQRTVQQIWRFDRDTNITTVSVEANVRFHSVTLGYDVIARFSEGEERYSAVFTHPMLNFQFRVIKDMNKLDETVVSVVASVPRTTNTIRVLPDNKHSQAFATLFDWNSMTVGIQSWASEIFQPIAYKLVTTEIQFPRICYNCPV